MAIILDNAYHLLGISNITVIIILLLLLIAQHHCWLLDILCKSEWMKSLFIFHSLCSSWSDREETWITATVNWHVMVTGITEFHCVASNCSDAGVISVSAIAFEFSGYLWLQNYSALPCLLLLYLTNCVVLSQYT